MILHHIQTSALTDNALNTCLRYIHPNDSILLAGDAVNCLLQSSWQLRLASVNLFVLYDDIHARGIQQHIGRIAANMSAELFHIIDYSNFVEQSLKHNKVITW
ncbi:sulfurtransferase complex subunit TusB [Shewanella ulleungensis]|uniref:Sulfurtransferase TusB n=1 Tax=Shewanella ulleungensis TaxID=2282699 RepID=A0ABQ2QLN0_9GAMM|nr:sulfurtransferase complex subunit TusB [Shewanella ulleungensis]MCL1151795.1 sulfurtransferase complex subunit TusB [Shewanella ulleungensis]GGP84528.1 sulfurtransferase TusB [Shewanella ulleungensis]